MTRLTWALMLSGAASQAHAQTVTRAWSAELTATAGVGHVFRFEDTTFGNGPNVGVGVAVRHQSGLGVELDVDRTFGLTPAAAPCAIVIDGSPASCTGTGRNGVLAAIAVSVRARYEFGRGRAIRPYVSAGPGWLMTRSVWSTATVTNGQVLITEREQRDLGVGPDLGVGIRFGVGPRLALSPEVRWVEGAARSAVNLAVTRASLRLSLLW